MSSPAVISAPTLSPVEAFKLKVLPPERAAELHRALPAHIRPERFERNLLNALMQNPDLLKCHAGLVYREVSKAAGLGLVLDPEIGEAYILTVYNPKTRERDLPQLRVGYRGLLRLARQSGEVAACFSHAVHENDFIECELGDNPKLIHKPKLFGERGQPIGYYAVVRYKDGTTDFEPMNREDVDKIRARSDAYKAFAAGKIKSTPWQADYDEMAKKTAMRRLLKRVPKSPDLADALAVEDAGDRARDITPIAGAAAAPAAPPSKLDALEDQSGPAIDVPGEDETMNPETGEVIEAAEEVAEAPAEPPPARGNAVLDGIIADVKDATNGATIDGILAEAADNIEVMKADDRKRLENVVALRRAEITGKKR